MHMQVRVKETTLENFFPDKENFGFRQHIMGGAYKIVYQRRYDMVTLTCMCVKCNYCGQVYLLSS